MSDEAAPPRSNFWEAVDSAAAAHEAQLAEIARHPGRPPSRTGAMLKLLNGMWTHVDAAERTRAVMVMECTTTGARKRMIEPASIDALLRAEAHAAFFRKLAARGYCAKTTWEELSQYLPDLCRQARQVDGQTLEEHRMANMVIAASALRLAEGARRFLSAAQPAMHFLAPDDETEK